jgi:hypothetical protein
MLEHTGESRDVYQTLTERPRMKLGCATGLRAEGWHANERRSPGIVPRLCLLGRNENKEERKREKGKVLTFLKKAQAK